MLNLDLDMLRLGLGFDIWFRISLDKAELR